MSLSVTETTTALSPPTGSEVDADVEMAVPLTAALRIVMEHLWRTRVLGQSCKEATEAMIGITEPPGRLVRVSRRNPEQSRLFDTQEIVFVDDREWRAGGLIPFTS